VNAGPHRPAREGADEELARRGPRRVAHPGASEHPRQLLHPLVRVKGGHPAGGAFPDVVLADVEVVVRAGGDLGQVGDAQDLPMLGERAEPRPDRRRHRAADAGVHLVEHVQAHRTRLREHRLRRQQDA